MFGVQDIKGFTRPNLFDDKTAKIDAANKAEAARNTGLRLNHTPPKKKLSFVPIQRDSTCADATDEAYQNTLADDQDNTANGDAVEQKANYNQVA